MTTEQAMAELWGTFCPDAGPTDYAATVAEIKQQLASLTAQVAKAPHEFYVCRGDGTCDALCKRVDEDGCCVSCGADPVRVDYVAFVELEAQVSTLTEQVERLEHGLRLAAESWEESNR